MNNTTQFHFDTRSARARALARRHWKQLAIEVLADSAGGACGAYIAVLLTRGAKETQPIIYEAIFGLVMGVVMLIRKLSRHEIWDFEFDRLAYTNPAGETTAIRMDRVVAVGRRRNKVEFRTSRRKKTLPLPSFNEASNEALGFIERAIAGRLPYYDPNNTTWQSISDSPTQASMVRFPGN